MLWNPGRILSSRREERQVRKQDEDCAKAEQVSEMWLGSAKGEYTAMKVSVVSDSLDMYRSSASLGDTI